MIILPIITLILSLIGLGWSVFIIVSMMFNGDGNLVLFIPFIFFTALTIYSLKWLKKARNK
ncbi:MAG: hypothetical protein V4524_00655 [Patescibacteria group bacterium]